MSLSVATLNGTLSPHIICPPGRDAGSTSQLLTCTDGYVGGPLGVSVLTFHGVHPSRCLA